MSHAAGRHRELDRRAAQAMGEQPGHALVNSRNRRTDMRTMTDRKPRVLLLEVEIRTSERTGRPWYSAWLGRCRLVGFESDEPNDRGHRVIRFYAEEPEPRDGTAIARQRASGSEAPSPSTGAPPAPIDRHGASYRAPRPESVRGRQEPVSAEVAGGFGVHADEDLNDAVPF